MCAPYTNGPSITSSRLDPHRGGRIVRELADVQLRPPKDGVFGEAKMPNACVPGRRGLGAAAKKRPREDAPREAASACRKLT